MVELARVNEEDAMRWDVTPVQEAGFRLEGDAARQLVDALGADVSRPCPDSSTDIEESGQPFGLEAGFPPRSHPRRKATLTKITRQVTRSYFAVTLVGLLIVCSRFRAGVRCVLKPRVSFLPRESPGSALCPLGWKEEPPFWRSAWAL